MCKTLHRQGVPSNVLAAPDPTLDKVPTPNLSPTVGSCVRRDTGCRRCAGPYQKSHIKPTPYRGKLGSPGYRLKVTLDPYRVPH